MTAGHAALLRQPHAKQLDVLGHGTVLAIETHMLHPSRGFIKLEDTVCVTQNGYEMFGTEGRGWNIGGTA